METNKAEKRDEYYNDETLEEFVERINNIAPGEIVTIKVEIKND